MPIRIDKPVGTGWQYSLDQVNWQTSPVFQKAAGNVDFLVGNAYLVYCRNQAQNAFSQDVIIFGAQNNQFPLLDQVASAGTTEQRGKTNQLLKLLGGLFLDNIPSTTEDFPQLVLGPDGKVWKRAGVGIVTPPDTWTIGAHYIEVDGEESPIYAEVDRANFTPDSSTPSATGVYRIATPSGVVFPNLSVNEGATLQLRLEQEFSDNTWVVVSDPTWSVVTGSLTTGVTISSGGLLSVPADIITTSTYVGVNAVVGGITYSTPVTIVNLNPIEN